MSPDKYDGVLQYPFLAEHWHKGLMAAFASWLPVFFSVSVVLPMREAVAVATAFSLGILLAVVTHYEGFTLDLPARRYRRYTWVAGLRFGRWQDLPPLERITVRYLEHRHRLPLDIHPLSIGVTATERVWQVLLGVSQSQVGIVVANTTQKRAHRIAATLATLLNMEVVLRS